MDNVANTLIENKPITANLPVGKSPKNKKLFITVGVIILIIVSLLVLFMNNLLPFGKKSSDTSVQLKTEYENPFDEKTQYKNPFSQEEYQNPFDFGQ